MAQELSERQVKMLKFIGDFIADHHFPPTIREIGNKVRETLDQLHAIMYNRMQTAREAAIQTELAQ